MRVWGAADEARCTFTLNIKNSIKGFLTEGKPGRTIVDSRRIKVSNRKACNEVDDRAREARSPGNQNFHVQQVPKLLVPGRIPGDTIAWGMESRQRHGKAADPMQEEPLMLRIQSTDAKRTSLHGST